MQSLSTIDAQQCMIKFISAFPKFTDQAITGSKLADGYIFAMILVTVPNFHIVLEPLDSNNRNWTHKLKNLRKLLDYLEDYFEKTLHKGIKTDDIDLVSIAKNNDMESLTKLFQVVMSVLMESTNKEDYIEIIMNLDENSQSAFVKIIQNAMQHRTTSLEQIKASKYNSLITQYQAQNSSLQQYIQDLIHNNQELKKSNSQLQNQIKLLQEEAEFTAQNKAGSNYDHSQHENEQLKNMISNLKEKLIKTAIEHETQLAKLKDQYSVLQSKNLQLSQLEQQYNQLKTQLEENNEKLSKAHGVQKDKLKLMRIIDQKDLSIKKQQQKIQQLTTTIYKMQEKELELTMELKRKELKMKGFQKQIKEKIQSANENGLDISIPNLDLTNEQVLKEDIQEYKNDLTKRQEQVQILEKKIKELQKKAQKVDVLENDKKKLENAIRQLDKIKTQQINILITITSQLRDDNFRLQEEGKKVIG